jgi:ribosomal protein S30
LTQATKGEAIKFGSDVNREMEKIVKTFLAKEMRLHAGIEFKNFTKAGAGKTKNGTHNLPSPRQKKNWPSRVRQLQEKSGRQFSLSGQLYFRTNPILYPGHGFCSIS